MKRQNKFDRTDGRTGWAVWNGCQGIFTETVRYRRAEVQKLFSDYPGDIVPVLVWREPDEMEVMYRGWEEDEKDENDPVDLEDVA